MPDTINPKDLFAYIKFIDANGGDYAHVRAFIARDREGIGLTWREPWDGLVIDCQIDPTCGKGDKHYHSYGWEVAYREQYSVNLEKAQVIVKALSKIGAALKRKHDREGAPVTFGQYMVRVLTVMGVGHAVIVNYRDRNLSEVYNADRFGEVASTIDCSIQFKCENWDTRWIPERR